MTNLRCIADHHAVPPLNIRPVESGIIPDHFSTGWKTYPAHHDLSERARHPPLYFRPTYLPPPRSRPAHCRSVHFSRAGESGGWSGLWCERAFKWLQRISWQCLNQSESGTNLAFVFWSVRNSTHLVEVVEILLPFKFCGIPFSSFREEVEKISTNQMPGWRSWFSDKIKNTILVEDVETYFHVKFHWIFLSDFREVENVSANQRLGPKSTNMKANVEILLPVKCHRILISGFRKFENVSTLIEDVAILFSVIFHWIPFSSFIEEVKNVSANQRKRTLWFFNRLENTNMIANVEILLPGKFH